ncbi:MAG: hypothetical protein J4A00_01605 [Gammaproteobacteria bacterium]|nr:hypothetical protein [Gammaproteobacteria bacterium]
MGLPFLSYMIKGRIRIIRLVHDRCRGDIVFALCNLALYRMKKWGPAPWEVWTAPTWLPLWGFLVSTAFLPAASGNEGWSDLIRPVEPPLR